MNTRAVNIHFFITRPLHGSLDGVPDGRACHLHLIIVIKSRGRTVSGQSTGVCFERLLREAPINVKIRIPPDRTRPPQHDKPNQGDHVVPRRVIGKAIRRVQILGLTLHPEIFYRVPKPVQVDEESGRRR